MLSPVCGLYYKKGGPPEREMVDVKDIIQEMIVLLSDEALPHFITIHSELDAEKHNVLADGVQLQQVFMNLVLNAIEAMKDAGGEMAIRSGLNQEGQLPRPRHLLDAYLPRHSPHVSARTRMAFSEVPGLAG